MTLTPAQLRQVREVAERTTARATGSLATKAELASLSLTAGAVTSVNGQAGAVVLNTSNVSEGGTNLYVSSAQRSKLDSVVYVFTETVTFPSTVAQGNAAGSIYFDRTATILYTSIWCDVAPVSASVIVDAHKNGTTIYTTQANRPTIATAGRYNRSVTPNVTSLVQGDAIQFQVDQINAGDQGDIGQLYCRITWTETVF